MKIIKIKDDVEMNVLYDYGFDLNEREWYEIDMKNASLKIAPVSRYILIDPWSMAMVCIPGVLHDLIIDGLTEVIDTEEEEN